MMEEVCMKEVEIMMNPPIQCIAMDMDGTLLRDDQTIDPITLASLRRAQEQGIMIILATGRDKGGVDFASEALGLEQGNHYMAGVNGQIIYSYAKREYWADEVLGSEDAKRILHTAKKYGCEAICFCGYDLYDFVPLKMRMIKKAGSLFKGVSKDYGLKQGKRNFIRITSPDYEITQDINKCIYIQTIPFFQRHLESIRLALSDYDLVCVGPTWIEVMPKGVSKGSAILRIAAENHIPKEAILCFGDAENDLSMMELIPHSIAMGNAMEIVKQKAWQVTDTNMNNGIAKALDRYVFQSHS